LILIVTLWGGATFERVALISIFLSGMSGTYVDLRTWRDLVRTGGFKDTPG